MPVGLADVDDEVVPLERALVPITDPGFTTGWTVFETARGCGGALVRLDAHLDRLDDSAKAACLGPIDCVGLRRRAERLAAAHGGDLRLRITLTGGGRAVLVATDVDPTRRRGAVRCVRGPHCDEPFLGGGVKHGSRAPWRVAVRRSGVDDVLLVDGAGRFTEGTTCGIVAVCGGVLWTAPHDGRILASTTVTALLDIARAQGTPVRREGPCAEGPWDGLYVASATRGLAPVVELDGVPLPGWEPVGLALADALDREEVEC